jgi:hypothetical protein
VLPQPRVILLAGSRVRIPALMARHAPLGPMTLCLVWAANEVLCLALEWAACGDFALEVPYQVIRYSKCSRVTRITA